MTVYRKKPVLVKATQWLKNGDHPEDHISRKGTTPDGEGREGQVVRYFRTPYVLQDCSMCGRRMHDHGWIDTYEGGHTVCPGDYIITGVKGERYPCKPDIFHATYEEVTEEAYLQRPQKFDETSKF